MKAPMPPRDPSDGAGSPAGPTGGAPADAAVLEIGSRIRAFREAQGLSLRRLATLSGLSVGFLSQVERGLSSIALSSLHSVATALGRSMAELFGEEPAAVPDDSIVFTLTRAAERPRRVVSTGRHYEMLSARFPGLLLEPMLVYIEPGGPLEEAVGHDGEEFAYVISGELLYEVAGVEHRLGPGDSLYLRSNTPHRLYNSGTETTVVVSVVTPRYY
jgi:transcriptional regulator with XRE-family HTH domain